MSETKHTPGPWHLHDMESATICGSDDVAISDCNARHRYTPTNNANAQFIVTACNAHADMLAALEACEAFLAFHGPVGATPDTAALTLKEVRAAIAKAKGQA